MRIRAIRLPRPHRRRRRGMTLMELIIATAISSLVMIVVAGLQWNSSIATKELYNESRTRTSRMRALDQIRYTLIMAKRGNAFLQPSDGDATQGYRRLRFQNPMNGAGVWSAYFFDATAKTLYYDNNVADSNPRRAVSNGPIDVRFLPLNNGATIRLRVKSEARMRYADVDQEEGEMNIYLRNS